MGSQRQSPRIFRRKSAVGGFTLLEMMATVAIIVILVGLLSSALNGAKVKALKLNCFDNLKQLQLAWVMYYDDNDGRLPLNQTAGVSNKLPFRRNSVDSWVVGSPLEDATTKNIERGTLYPYVQNPVIYKCPLDEGTLLMRADTPRTRSYTMNAFLAGDDAGKDPRVKSYFSELRNPGPENVFVFIEEHAESVWNANFVLPAQERILAGASWNSIPSDRHHQGCNISFADGHVEYWRWYSPKKVNSTTHLAGTSNREVADMRRLQACTPAP